MATYKQIQDWVKRNYGFSIETCWIAHVKDMCGIITGIAPNRIDAEKRIKPCPMDKVEPIKKAFKYFGMI